MATDGNDLRAHDPGAWTPDALVGREHKMSELMTALEHALGGHGHRTSSARAGALREHLG